MAFKFNWIQKKIFDKGNMKPEDLIQQFNEIDQDLIFGNDQVIGQKINIPKMDDIEELRRNMRKQDAEARLEKLTETQKWMFDKYQKDWTPLTEEPVQFYANGGYGVFGNVVAIKPDKDFPILTQFEIVDTEDMVKWYHLWNFEFVSTPRELLVKTRASRLAEVKKKEDEFTVLNKHKMIEKAYLSGNHLIVITQPTFAVHRDTGKEIKSIPMGRWVFDIRMDGNLNDVYLWNLDFANVRDGGVQFHFFRCWGGHPGQTLPLFKAHDYFSIVDFCILFVCTYPHDGYLDVIRWAKNRIKITEKEKNIVEIIMQDFENRKPTRWIVGKPTADTKKIADLFREDITLPDKYRQAKDPKAEWEVVKYKKDIKMGMIIKVLPEAKDYAMTNGKLGTVIGIDTGVRFQMIGEFENQRRLYFQYKDIMKLKDQDFTKEEELVFVNSKRYPYEGDEEDGRGGHGL